jgi:predicted lactoylglutathione lyase
MNPRFRIADCLPSGQSRDEIDDLHARWSAAGARIAEPPAAKPWKLYEFLAGDLDGNVLRVFYDFGWEERETTA